MIIQTKFGFFEDKTAIVNIPEFGQVAENFAKYWTNKSKVNVDIVEAYKTALEGTFNDADIEDCDRTEICKAYSVEPDYE
jgi:hypothetical protein